MSFELTMEGVTNGIPFASRIVLLMISSSLLVRTTDPGDMARGFAAMLTPLRFFGISRNRVASILSSAWDAFPDLWDTTRQAIYRTDFRKAGTFRSLLTLLSEIVARLYIETESKGDLLKKRNLQKTKTSSCAQKSVALFHSFNQKGGKR